MSKFKKDWLMFGVMWTIAVALSIPIACIIKWGVTSFSAHDFYSILRLLGLLWVIAGIGSWWLNRK